MARRIFVVLSQSPNSSPPRRHLEEELVTQLLMESGIEVNVIPHLADLAGDATGLLCLEGISGDMVMLSWLPHSEAWSYLDRYGIRGRRGLTQLAQDLPSTNGQPGAMDGNGSGTPGRSIYLLSLLGAELAEPFLAEIRRIRDDRSVQTFQLGSLGSAPLPVVSVPSSSPTAPKKTEPAPAQRNTFPSTPLATPSPQPQPQSQSQSRDRFEQEMQEEERQEAELDRLIDQLDELDV